MKIEEHHEEHSVIILDLQGKLMIGEGDVMLREKIEGLVEANLLAEDPQSGDLALTERGRMLADSVFQAFV